MPSLEGLDNRIERFQEKLRKYKTEMTPNENADTYDNILDSNLCNFNG